MLLRCEDVMGSREEQTLISGDILEGDVSTRKPLSSAFKHTFLGPSPDLGGGLSFNPSCYH